MVHNLVLGAFTNVGGGTGTRYTPYHIRHRTEVAGFMTILHGDDRFYNNIFVQGFPLKKDKETGEPKEKDSRVGTWCWDEYPTYDEWIKNFDLDVARPDMGKLEKFHNDHLPVWVDGNVYFNGARACKNEKHNLVDNENKVFVKLSEKDGKFILESNVYDYIKDFRDGIITSDILGKAFEPDQRFENPDGSAITFDRDFFGNSRSLSALPGPFAEAFDKIEM